MEKLTIEELESLGFNLGPFDRRTFDDFYLEAEMRCTSLKPTMAINARPNHGSKNKGAAILFTRELWYKMLGQMEANAEKIPEVFVINRDESRLRKCEKNCKSCDLSCLVE